MNESSAVFTFTAYQEIGPAKDVCFIIILLVYLVTVIANISVMLLIFFDPALHKPMYIFLFDLLLIGLIGSTAVWPCVLVHLATNVHSVSYAACFIQTYVISAYGGCVYMSLTVMAYDRYVCIFQPLQYHTIMTPRKVRILLVIANLIPAIVVLGQIILALGTPLCSHSIHKICCNNLAVSSLACRQSTHTHIASIYGLCLVLLLVILPMLLVLVSYSRIIVLTYKLSGDARKKAFVTCTPHLITFLNFSVCSVFVVVYHRAHAKVPVGGHVFLSTVYILLPPVLHPLVYGIKNQEIRKRFLKITRSVLLRTGCQVQRKTSTVSVQT